MFEGFRAVRSALDNGNVSSRELVSACLERIEAVDGFYAAWMYVDADHAMAHAEAADARRMQTSRDPSLLNESLSLEGIPVGFKDSIAVAGLPMTLGSPAYRDRIAVVDAALVQRFRAAGAIVLGKQRLHELGLGDAVSDGEFRTSRHPWNDTYAPGGSSCGSAVATALGMAQISIGGDTGGSVRNPAASSGVVGLKPTTGLLDGDGIAPLCWSLDTPGFMGRSVTDVRAALAASLPASHPRSTPPTNVRVGVPANGLAADVAPSIRRALEDASNHLPQLAGRGIHRIEVDEVPALPLGDAGPIWQNRLGEMTMAHAIERATNKGFSRAVLKLLDSARQVTLRDYANSFDDAIRFTHSIDAAFESVHVLLLPTNPRPALPWDLWVGSGHDDSAVFEWYRFLWPFNISGHPAVSLPWGQDEEGMPLALQLVAPRGQDVALLDLAELLETSAPPLPRRPPGIA